jgi:hypothetical protein
MDLFQGSQLPIMVGTVCACMLALLFIEQGLHLLRLRRRCRRMRSYRAGLQARRLGRPPTNPSGLVRGSARLRTPLQITHLGSL